MSLVEISQLSIAYRRRARSLAVIRDLSLSIDAGEAYGLVGESGCGKTTVAMALMRYLPGNAVIEHGEIRFDGHDVYAASPLTLRAWRGRRIAMVYQDPGSALNPSMRIGSQIVEVCRRDHDIGRSDALTAASDLLEKVQIANPAAVLRRYPHELSGGQQQRVMIAMALASNPDLLVLDEPTTGLDATVEAEVIDLVQALRSEFSSAILFISHNMGIVARLCDRTGVLYAGRLIEEAPTRQLFSAPHHPYTLGLLRCVPRLGVRKDVRRLDPIPGALPAPGTELPGCPYAPRCPICVERCHVELPRLETVAPDRSARCFLHDEVVAMTPSAAAAPVAGPEPEEAVLLDVSALAKRYRSGGTETVAVAGVTFQIRRGEVFGLVGESGSGKTTLARCIVGLTDPSGGEISFDQLRLSARTRRRNRDLRRRLQIIFQNPDTALNPRRSVQRILSRSIKLLGEPVSRPTRRARVTELARSVRLESRYLEGRPAALSGGLKQRVAIARALSGVPSLVLCDEPVSALDVSVQAAILNLLVDLQSQEQISYLFISHDLAVVRYIADRIGVMYLGQLVDIGPAEAVFGAPHHPYTEALVSAIPTLDPSHDGRRIKLHGSLPSPADPPSGCRFHTRCHRYLGDVCRLQEPPWQLDESGNRYRCHIEPGELGRLQGAAGDPAKSTPSRHSTSTPA